jgi:DEAD/DEAH box helicase
MLMQNTNPDVWKQLNPVNPKHFEETMEEHWTKVLGNVSNPALRETWYQIASTFGNHIYHHDTPEKSKLWTVLSPPTGSGKTESTIIYAALLSKQKNDRHPGMLIVTRLKADCDRIADRINKFGIQYGGQETAVSYHSGRSSELKITDLKDYPVAVITHRAYEMALDYLGNDSEIDKTWSHFQRYGRNMDYPIQWDKGEYSIDNRYGYDLRRLIVIDECMDIVEHNKASLDKLRVTLSAIPTNIRRKHPEVISEIRKMITLLEDWDQQIKAGEKNTKETLMWNRPVEELKDPGFMALINDLKGIQFDHQINKNDPMERQRLRQIHEKRLKDLYYIHRHWAYYANHKDHHTLNTARLLVPEGIKGCVVMDATASTNKVYDLHDDSEKVPPPDGSRRYDQFRLHVTKGCKVGKHHMVKNASRLSQSLIHDLQKRLSPDNKVLIVCHKDVRPLLTQCLPPESNWMTAHWGKVDGSNEWKDCDTVVIFGLNYMPDTWSPNVFMAFQGVQDTDWLGSDGDRPFGDYEDIRKALKRGQLSTSIIQALNRVRCRKVVDEHGNCEPTEGYILLPDGELAEAILEDIQKMMPGIKIDQFWNYTEQKRKVKRSNYELSLIRYIENMSHGRYTPGRIRRELKIPKRTMSRLTAKAKDDQSKLYKAMQDNGVIFNVQQEGSTRRAYFIKD